MPQSARESLIRKFLLLCGLPLALANADVVVNTFEVGADSLLYCDSWASDSSKAVLSLDSANPLDGRASARLDYVLDPNVTQYPWVGAFSSFRGLADLRTATGIRIKLHSNVDNRVIELGPASNWYPLPHANRSVTWQWDFPIRKGDLDTILYLADAKLPAWAPTQEPYLTSTVPPIADILPGVTGVSFNLRSSLQPISSAQAGSVTWDDIAVVGQNTLVAGADPKILFLRDYFDSAIASHPDSVPSTWYWANAASGSSVKRNTFLPSWGPVDIRFDFRFANDPANPWGAYAGMGVGLRGDSAWDLRGTTRWEFAQNTPEASRNVWVHLASNRYPQELVDSGITYGWSQTFHSSIRNWEGQVLYTDSLKPPTWASGHTRLLAMLPPIDSVLKGVTGIELSPLPDFLSDGSVDPATASSFFQVNHFQAIGVDQWIPSPPKPKDTTAVPPEDSTKSVPVRTFEIGVDSLVGSGIWANDSSKVSISLDSTTPLAGKASARLDYILNPKTNTYPYAGASSWLRGTYDLRNATGIRIKLRSLIANTKIQLFVASNWYPLPHLNRDVTWQWDFPLPLGELDTTLYFSKVGLPPISDSVESNLAKTIPRLQDILQGATSVNFGIRSSNEPIATSVNGAILWDDISVVGTDTLLPGSDPKILVLRDYMDSAIAAHSDSVPDTWHWSSSKSTATVSRNRFEPTWDSVDIRCDFTLANDPGISYSAYAGCGLGFHGDSAGDLRGTTRWEFAQNVPVTRQMRIDLASNRYPQILVDSGITYGWNVPFNSSFRWWEGTVVYTDSLKAPSWAAGHARLLALLPPVDSILKGVTGINVSPQPDFLSDGSVNPATASGFFQVNHFLAIGVDRWIPSPGQKGGTTASKVRVGVRPWTLVGRRLSNTGTSPLEVLDLQGRSRIRLPPSASAELPVGSHLIRQAGSSRIIAVP